MSDLRRWWDDAIGDIRHAARLLLRNKAYAVVAVCALALGSGANVAIYAVLHDVLLRPMPRLQEYVQTIMAVIDAGYVDRVCLSADFSNQKYLRKNGGPGIAMVMTTMVPRLRQAGVNEATLHKILVENPRRAIAFVPKT